LVLERSSFTGLGLATCIDLTCDLHDRQCLLRRREKDILTLAKHLKDANRKLTEMRGKLQQKKQVINEYRLGVKKAEQEIVELNKR
jgi:wobble nucleotide-excising tRNase